LKLKFEGFSLYHFGKVKAEKKKSLWKFGSHFQNGKVVGSKSMSFIKSNK